jgi:DNA-directed RNA polymerase specialized sigma24 family protein
MYPAGENVTACPDGAIDARLQLRAAKAMVTPDEWALLWAIGAGYKYAEIAAAASIAAGALRIRVLRLRRTLLVQRR